MTKTLIASTADGTGKTAIAIALARIARERGATVGYMKPKGTRLRSAVGKTRDDDPLLAAELLDLDAPIEDLEPVVYSPTFVAEAIRGRESADAVRERVKAAFNGLAADVDATLVEGGGDVWTGGVVDLADPDVADLVDARVVLVANYHEAADVDDVLAAADAFGDRLAGVLFNAVAEEAIDDVTQEVVPFLDGRGVRTLGVLPRDPELAGVTVEELADELGAETLVGESGGSRRIERFAVGAMGSESALEHFRRLRDAAVVTGGDRADVQTVAIQATGVACLILTGGRRPPATVLGAAQENGTPVLLVGADTRATVDRLESVLATGRTRGAAVVDRMGELLDEGVDVDLVLGLGDGD